jgi:FixJ family two-component response regulator
VRLAATTVESAPVILLADHDDLPITQISNAFYDGAELMLHKPLANPAVLIDCIRDCCRRLDHWGRLLIHHAP